MRHVTVRRLIILFVLIVACLINLTARALASEGEFISLINSTRANSGLGALSVDASLSAYARTHTQEMIAQGDLFHSSSSQLSSAAIGWSQLGENVGRGQTPATLHDAFMASATHAENVLGDYDYVGVGVGTDVEGRLYVTIVFMKAAVATMTTSTTTTVIATTIASSTTTTAPAAASVTPTTTAPPTAPVPRTRCLPLGVYV